MRETTITLKGVLTKEQTLAAIKQLRDHVNDNPMDANVDNGWVNETIGFLDQAADAIEFPAR